MWDAGSSRPNQTNKLWYLIVLKKGFRYKYFGFWTGLEIWNIPSKLDLNICMLQKCLGGNRHTMNNVKQTHWEESRLMLGTVKISWAGEWYSNELASSMEPVFELNVQMFKISKCFPFSRTRRWTSGWWWPTESRGSWYRYFSPTFLWQNGAVRQ